MDIIHVAAWIVVIFFGLALLKGLLGEPLYSYAILGAIGLGIIGFAVVFIVAIPWNASGHSLIGTLASLTIMILFGILCYYIQELAKALYRPLRNRSIDPDSPNRLDRSQSPVEEFRIGG